MIEVSHWVLVLGYGTLGNDSEIAQALASLPYDDIDPREFSGKTCLIQAIKNGSSEETKPTTSKRITKTAIEGKEATIANTKFIFVDFPCYVPFEYLNSWKFDVLFLVYNAQNRYTMEAAKAIYRCAMSHRSIALETPVFLVGTHIDQGPPKFTVDPSYTYSHLVSCTHGYGIPQLKEKLVETVLFPEGKPA